MSNRSRYREITNVVAFAITALCALLTLSILFFILGYVLIHGIGALNVDFFTKLPKPVGETGGGMANAIVGTIKLVGLAGLFGLPIGILGGTYLAEYGDGKFAFLVRYAADVINGVPSIVIGIVAYTMAVMPLRHFSALAGALALGMILIPISLRSTEEFLRLVPNAIREGALALGLPKWKVVLFVVFPTALSGISTGALLSLTRVSGETAPLLFTAFGNRFWSSGLLNPIASLPVMIFTYSIAPYDDWHRQAWAAALVLLMLVLVVNTGARLILRRKVTA